MLLKLMLFSLALVSSFSLGQGNIKVLINSCNDYLNAIKITDNYRLDYVDNFYKLSCNNNSIYIHSDNLILEEYNNNAYIIKYNNNILELYVYNNDLNIINKEKIYEGLITSDIYVTHNNILLYLLFGDENYNIKAFTFGEREFVFEYGGNLKDEIKCIYTSDDYLYIGVYKDSLSGGTFGNGGQDKAIILAKINLEMEVEKYITIDKDSEIINIECTNELLYFYTKDNLYVFDKDLNYISKKEISFDFVYTGLNDLIFTILNNKLIIYDSYTLNEIYSEEIDYDTIINLNKFLYVKKDNNGFIIDAINLSSIDNLTHTYNYKNNVSSIKSLFGECKQESIIYTNEYNKMIYGDYYLNINYITPYNERFSVNTTDTVPLNVNVKENMIYPSGYRLDFNSTATLDGNNIVMNYPVYGEGYHELILTGNNGIETKIHFYIKKDQKKFVDDYFKTNDIEVKTNEKIEVSFDVEGITSKDEITSIDVFNCTINNYDIINNKLIIEINSFSNSGNYSLYFDKINYIQKIGNTSFYREYYINEEINLCVLKEVPTITLLNIGDDYSFVFDSIDSDDTLRVIEIECINNLDSYYFYYPLTKCTLKLYDLKNGDYNCNIRILCNIGENEYSKIDLFSMKFTAKNNNYNLGELVINNLGSNVNRFTIKLNNNVIKDNISKVIVNNNELLVKKSNVTSTGRTILFSIIGAIVSFGIALLINYFYHSKNRKEA